MTPKFRFKKTIRSEARREALRLIDEYGIADSGGLLYIRTFADAYTIELNCKDKIDTEGLTILDRFSQLKAHPLCSVMRDARAQKLAALKALNLDLEPLRDGPGRPSGGK